MTLPELEQHFRKAALVYIPAGIPFYSTTACISARSWNILRKKVTAGLPLIGFSAGAILCGPNILTSKDMNTVENLRLRRAEFNTVQLQLPLSAG